MACLADQRREHFARDFQPPPVPDEYAKDFFAYAVNDVGIGGNAAEQLEPVAILHPDSAAASDWLRLCVQRSRRYMLLVLASDPSTGVPSVCVFTTADLYLRELMDTGRVQSAAIVAEIKARWPALVEAQLVARVTRALKVAGGERNAAKPADASDPAYMFEPDFVVSDAADDDSEAYALSPKLFGAAGEARLACLPPTPPSEAQEIDAYKRQRGEGLHDMVAVPVKFWVEWLESHALEAR